MSKHLTDREWLLHVLSDGRDHTLNEIIQRSFRERGCGLTVHSRAAELRKCGYTILNRPMPNGGRGSVYRLVALESPAIEEPGPQPVSLAGGSSAGDHAPPTGRSADGATAETPTLAPVSGQLVLTVPSTERERDMRA